MIPIQFEIRISAKKEKVWQTLWQDETFRDWAGNIDPGTYMVGDLLEGSTVQFNSAEGYGVTSLVASLVPGEYILFKHKADTKDGGNLSREDQWTGGSESYRLTEVDGITMLEMKFDVPFELEEIMKTIYPKALKRIKELSEG